MSNFGGMKWNIVRLWSRRGHYLLMDGMHSCAYIPRHTYRMLHRTMCRELDRNPKAENSLRFLWSRSADSGYLLTVNPQGVDMLRTHGLATDTGRRILVPCPYIQQIYQHCGLAPEWCGRVYLERMPQMGGLWLTQFKLKRENRLCR